MQPNSVGLVKPQTFTFGDNGDALILESGHSLGPVDIVYETYGKPNEDRSNAVLICHALSGDHHAAGHHDPHDRYTGWWDNMIGPGKAFDTDRFWLICTNIIGSCRGSTGPGSINPASGNPYGLDFPVVTIGDMVEAQRRLIDHLGIEQLYSVAGGSMGGFQVMEWALRFPE
ncbi:MAG: alpha/beta fold hydrolase, partial [Desulfosarcinaceae bacterium]